MDTVFSFNIVYIIYEKINFFKFILQGDVWICMEVMEASLDHFYKKLKKNNERIPETYMAKIAKSVSK